MASIFFRVKCLSYRLKFSNDSIRIIILMTLSSLKSVQRVQATPGVHQIHGPQLSLKRQCGVMSSYRREILFHAQVLSNILYLPKHN